METTPSFWNVFKQSFTEEDKGSGKRVTAFITILIIAFLCIYPTLKDQTIDTAIILELIAFICVLFGISSWKAVKTTQSDNQAKIDKA